MLIKEGFVPDSFKEGKSKNKYWNEALQDRRLKLLHEKTTQNQIGIISISRVGSNQLKFLLEEITEHHIVDLCRYWGPQQWLSEKGSLTTDLGHTQIIKSHYPWFESNRSPCEYKVKKVILMVREPLSALNSFFNMVCTYDHASKIENPSYIASPGYENWIKLICSELVSFHRFWKKQSVPIFWVRYEDMKKDKRGALTKLMQFMDGTPELSGYWVQRIDTVLKKSSENSTYRDASYKGQSVLQEHRPQFIAEIATGVLREFTDDCGYMSIYLPFIQKAFEMKSIPASIQEKTQDETFIQKHSDQSMKTVLSSKGVLPDFRIPKPPLISFGDAKLAQALLWSDDFWKMTRRYYITNSVLGLLLIFFILQNVGMVYLLYSFWPK